MPVPTHRLPDELAFSRPLAHSIGMEGAVLLQYLSEYGRPTGGGWANEPPVQRTIPLSELQQVFSWWSDKKLDEYCKRLVKQGLMKMERENDGLSYCLYMSLNPIATREHAVVGAHRIGPDWQPSTQALQLLERQHGIAANTIQAVIAEFALYWSQRGDAKQNWDSHFIRHVISSHRNRNEVAAMQIDAQWQPSAICLKELVQEGIPADFVSKLVTSFIRYWLEHNPAAGYWDSKFAKHCKQKWQYQNANPSGSQLAQPLGADWQPSSDVYHILEMSNIDREYADKQLPEFKLYWQERGESRESWGSCFIQHVKRVRARERERASRGSDWDRFVSHHSDAGWRNERN